jgi:hypothetical protein
MLKNCDFSGGARARARLLLPMLLSALPAVLLRPNLAQACATCGCTLSSDAAMGYSSMPGWRLSLEYDYINQDELRSGTRAVAGVPDGYELEHDTLTRYITAGVNYAPSSSWNFQLLVPYVVRAHSTYGTYDSAQPLPPLSSSHSSSLGDARLIANFQGLLPTRELGVQLGLKLPTGRYGTAVDFDSGPSAGTPLDASLQPGTGSTDIIVGAYFHHAISLNLALFASAQFQSAVKQHLDQPGDDYRPGNSTTGILGLRYEADSRWVPQLQVNLLHKSPDRGALADLQNTAGTVIYISPGLTARVLDKLYAFGFVQLPAYSNLYGYQLFPHYTVSVGLSYAP